MTTARQRRLIDELGLVEGQRHRGQCPFCFRNNTFTAEKKNGRVVYNCYSVYCGRSGVAQSSVTLDDVRIAKPQEAKSFRTFDVPMEEKPAPFTLPESFVDVSQSDKAVSWLQRYNCWEAVQEGRAQVRYDLALDRLVFLITRDGEYYGAVGRYLGMDMGIAQRYKWFVYAGSTRSYLVRSVRAEATQKHQVVLVEDCASACSVSRCTSSMALLGTSLLLSTIKEIVDKGFEIVYIGLDPDARAKQIKLLSQLQPFVNTKIVNFPDDPKYLSVEKIQECLA